MPAQSSTAAFAARSNAQSSPTASQHSRPLANGIDCTSCLAIRVAARSSPSRDSSPPHRGDPEVGSPVERWLRTLRRSSSARSSRSSSSPRNHRTESFTAVSRAANASHGDAVSTPRRSHSWARTVQQPASGPGHSLATAEAAPKTLSQCSGLSSPRVSRADVASGLLTQVAASGGLWFVDPAGTTRCVSTTRSANEIASTGPSTSIVAASNASKRSSSEITFTSSRGESPPGPRVTSPTPTALRSPTIAPLSEFVPHATCATENLEQMTATRMIFVEEVRSDGAALSTFAPARYDEVAVDEANADSSRILVVTVEVGQPDDDNGAPTATITEPEQSSLEASQRDSLDDFFSALLHHDDIV